MATCAITGTIRRADETGVEDAIVRLTPAAADEGAAEAAGGVGVALLPVEQRTAPDGTFSISAIQGYRFRLEIPVIGFDREFTCPAVASVPFDQVALVPVMESVVDYTDLASASERVIVTVRTEPIETLLRRWDTLAIERAAARGGPWTEVTAVALSDAQVLYEYTDTDGSAGDHYRARYRDSSGPTDSPAGQPLETATTADSLLMTPKELREFYLFGIDLTDDEGRPYSDQMLRYYIQAAQAWLEKELDLPMVETQYTNETHDHYAQDYGHWGFFQLQRYPVNSVQQVKFQYPSMDDEVIINNDWIVVPEGGAHGQIQIVPGQGNIADVLLIPGMLMPLWSGATGRVPGIWRFTYRAGFTPTNLPADLKDLIGMRASLGLLDIAGDLVAGAGIASISIGVPGLNQSIGTTSSATNSGYGARIKSYSERIKQALPHVKQYYGKRTRLIVV